MNHTVDFYQHGDSDYIDLNIMLTMGNGQQYDWRPFKDVPDSTFNLGEIFHAENRNAEWGEIDKPLPALIQMFKPYLNEVAKRLGVSPLIVHAKYHEWLDGMTKHYDSAPLFDAA